MRNNPADYDLLNEVDCSDDCEAVDALCELVDKLVKDIQHLELECISTRYLLSKKLGPEQGALLKLDILENLGHRYKDDPAYTLYRKLMYDGGDPMDFHEFLAKVKDAREGRYPCWH